MRELRGRKMTIKCFYHGSDLDGWASGAIVRYWYEKEGNQVEMFPINYGDKFPMDQITKSDLVYVVDFSLPVEKLQELDSKCNYLIWIDHHFGIIKEYLEKNTSCKSIYGFRSINSSACELTWDYLFPAKDTPRFIRLLGLYDRWEHNDPSEPWDDIEAFQYGFKVRSTNPRGCFEFWREWFENLSSVPIFTVDVIDSGRLIQKYVEGRFKSSLTERSFVVDWEGYKCLVINGDPYIANYLTRAKEFEGCDIGINFCNSKGEFWIVNLRTARDDIDLSALAKKYGGGGHRAAAGFPCKVLPFKEISTGAL